MTGFWKYDIHPCWCGGMPIRLETTKGCVQVIEYRCPNCGSYAYATCSLENCESEAVKSWNDMWGRKSE